MKAKELKNAANKTDAVRPGSGGALAKYKNTHGVPAEKVGQQASRFQRFPETRIAGPGHWPDGSRISVSDGEAYEIEVRHGRD